MYQVYIGEKKSLVFPAMCDSYLLIEYRQGNTSTVEPYGIWDLDDSFTIEALVTPYDVNGFGWQLAGSTSPVGDYGIDANYLTKKSIPQNKTAIANTYSQSDRYLSRANRVATATGNDGYIMSLFYNKSVEVYLQNISTTNHNQPAEYQVCFSMTITPDTPVTHTIRTGPIIESKAIHHGKSIEGTISNQKYHTDTDTIKYDRIGSALSSTITAGSSAPFTFTVSGTENEYFYPEQELYTISGTQTKTTDEFQLVGIVDSVTSSLVTLKATPTASAASGTSLYTPTKREAPYLLNYYHIAATYNKNTGNMSIYIDGALVVSEIHSGEYQDFSMYPEDCKIGQNATSTTTTVGSDIVTTYSQFFGEIHEFAISKGVVDKSLSIDTLVPQNRNLLLYYRFEERDA